MGLLRTSGHLLRLSLLGCVLLLASCSTGSAPAVGGPSAGQPAAVPAPPPVPAVGQSVPVDVPAAGFSLASLGSPSALLARVDAARSPSFSQAQGHKDGAQYAIDLPYGNVTVGGTALQFAPTGDDDLTKVAYAVYEFTLPDHQSGLNGSFNWGVPPAQADCFFALGNFIDDVWEWYLPADPAALTVTGASRYFDLSDRLLLVVAVTGTDAAGLTEIQLEGVEPPVADLTADVAAGLAPLIVTFDASASSDPDGTIMLIEWDFDGDGNFGEAGVELAAQDDLTPDPVTYSNPGTYAAAVRLTDDDGAQGQAQLNIEVNVAPEVSLGASVTVGDAPLEVTFTANATDANGTIATIEWDFDGDGSYGEAGAEATAADDPTPAPYTYTLPGAYNAAVVVTDDQNATAQDTALISVGSPPTVSLTADTYAGDKPLTVTFTAVANDAGGTIEDVEWDIDGNGVFNEVGKGEQARRGDLTPAPVTYGNVAERDPVVRVTDNDGGTATDTVHISITNSPPTAVIGSDVVEGDAPFFVTFNATASSDPGGSIVNYEWDFNGNGLYSEVGTGEDTAEGDATPAAYEYQTPGLATARVRVTDDNGATDVDSVIITKHGWAFVTVDDGSDGNVSQLQTALIDGNPALAYKCGSILRYARSSTATGNNPLSWVIVDIPVGSQSNPGRDLTFDEVSGSPAIAYTDSPGNEDLVYQVASGIGTTPADWTSPLTLDSTGTSTGFEPEIAVIGGNPAIAYDRDGDLYYTRSGTSSGSSVSDWSTPVNIDGGMTTSANGGYLEEVQGNPAACYYFFDGVDVSFLYCRSSTATGTGAGDWASKVTINAAASPYKPVMLTAAGNPAIAFVDTATSFWSYVRATDTTGGGWGAVVNIHPATPEYTNYNGMTLVGTAPAAVAMNTTDNDLMFVQSTTDSGSWPTPTALDTGDSIAGYNCEVISTSGNRPAVGFTVGGAPSPARYGILF